MTINKQKVPVESEWRTDAVDISKQDLCHSLLVYHLLLLAERALSRDYSIKMWSSENQYLTASKSKGG